MPRNFVNCPQLMGPDHPDGWKLEELLSQLQKEIDNKSEKIELDDKPVARHVLRNNQQIIGLLAQAEALQRNSYDVLDAYKINQGPSGTPRIGLGSDGKAGIEFKVGDTVANKMNPTSKMTIVEIAPNGMVYLNYFSGTTLVKECLHIDQLRLIN